MPSHLDIAVGLLDCPICQVTIDEPMIAPDGQSFGSGIHTWINDIRRTNPITRSALQANQLRSNLWLKNLLQNFPIPASATTIRIPCELLNNPATGLPFINPVVNEQDETVEGEVGAPYSNLLLKHLCEKKAQLDAAERAQRSPAAEAAQPSSISSGESVPLLSAQRLPVVAIATTWTVSLTAPRSTHPMQIVVSNNASAINIDTLQERLEEVWSIYNSRVAGAQRTANPAVAAPHTAVTLSELAVGDARDAHRDARQALSLVGRALESAKQNKGWAISATIAVLLATLSTILIILRFKIFADKNNMPTPSPGPTSAPTPSPAPTCIPPRYNVSYSFNVPFVPGGNLCVNNNGESDISLKGLTFTSNAILNGNPWNSLFPWQSTISSTPNGLVNDYSVAISSNVKIPAAQSACLTYNYNQFANATIIQAVGMNPTSVGVTYADGTTATLPMHSANPCALNPIPNYRFAAWYPNWGMYERNFIVADIPVQTINQINYAFFGFNASTGAIKTLDVFADSNQLPALALLQQQNPYLKTFAAVGGYCSNEQFNNLTANPNLVNVFADNLADLVEVGQFSGGAYIDWEGWGEQSCGATPNPQAYSQLFSTLRTTFDNRFGSGKRLIGINVPAGIDKINALPNSTWCDVQENTDHWDMMTYDYGGSFSDIMNYGSPMEIDPRDPTITDPILKYYAVKDTVNIYHDMTCISASKMGVGIPAYGRSAYVANATAPTFGLWQPVTGTPKGQYDTGSATPTGTFDYRCIILNSPADCHNFTQPPANFFYFPTDANQYGNVTLQPWGFAAPNSTTTFNFTMTFDDPTSAQAKAQLVRDQQLGGAFIWDISQDAPSGSGFSLTDYIYWTLSGSSPQSAAQIKRSVVANTDARVVPAAVQVAQNSVVFNSTTEIKTAPSPVNASATDFSSFIPERIQALLQIIPVQLRSNFLTTAGNTALYAVVPQALQTAITYQLHQSGYSKESIEKANLALQAFFVLLALLSHLSSTAAAFATSRFISYFMSKLGFSKESSETLATSAAAIAAISVSATTSSVEAVTAAAKVTILMVCAYTAAYEAAKNVLPRLGVSESTTEKMTNVVAGGVSAAAAVIASPLTAIATTAVLVGTHVGKKAGEKLAQFGIWNNSYIETDHNYSGVLIGSGPMRPPRVSTATLMRNVSGTIAALTAREKVNVFKTDDALNTVEEGNLQRQKHLV